MTGSTRPTTIFPRLPALSDASMKNPPPTPPPATQLERIFKLRKSGSWRIHIAPQAGLYRRPPGTHFHAAPELFLQTGGATDFECPGGSFRVAQNEFCVMPRGVPHAETPIDLRTPYHTTVFMHRADGFIVAQARATSDRKIVNDYETKFETSWAQTAFQHLDDISSADKISRPYRTKFIVNSLELFLILIIDELRRTPVTTRHRSPLVTQVENLAHTHLSNPMLSVAFLAEHLQVSADHLSRCFRLEHGIALKTWLIRERIEAARRLLLDSRYNINEVGWACGFNSPSYFIRMFERRNGITPRAFRAAHLPGDLTRK